jgi:hypothetical protein
LLAFHFSEPEGVYCKGHSTINDYTVVRNLWLASGGEKADLFSNNSPCMMSADRRNTFLPISRPVQTQILLCSIVILISAGSGAAAKELVAVTQANVMTEVSFTSRHVHQDPFNEVALDVIFLDPTGREMRVPAFWDGESLWKVRYSSPVVGTHRFRTVCSDPGDLGLHGVSGSVEIKPYTGNNPLFRNGQLRIGSSRRYLEYADGTPFFWLGDTWWMGLCNRLRWPGEFKTLVADRKEKGFTVIQIIAGLYPDMPPFDPRGANETGFPWTEDFTRIRPEYFDAADKRIFCLVDNGLTPCIVGAWGYFSAWMGVEKIKAHWRYLIGRYGALPVVWCAAGESAMGWYQGKDFTDIQQDQLRDWTEAMKYIRATDPFHRLLTIHPSGKGRASARNAILDPSLLDIDMLQTPHGRVRSAKEAVKTIRQSVADTPVMPVIDGECCYEMLKTKEDLVPADWARRMFWVSMLNGAAGHTYGANGIWQCNRRGQPYGFSPTGHTYGPLPWDEAMHLQGSTQIGLAKKLFESLPWQRLEPHPERVRYVTKSTDPLREEFNGPQAAGFPDQMRIIYVPEAEPIIIKDLGRALVYSAIWFDPVDGSRTSLPRISTSEDGSATLSPPAGVSHDWVVILTTKDDRSGQDVFRSQARSTK